LIAGGAPLSENLKVIRSFETWIISTVMYLWQLLEGNGRGTRLFSFSLHGLLKICIIYWFQILSNVSTEAKFSTCRTWMWGCPGVGGAAASADQTESNVEGSKKEGTIFFRVDCCCFGLVTTSTRLCSPLSSRSPDGAAAPGVPIFSIFIILFLTL
jgi:hypothetical protein